MSPPGRPEGEDRQAQPEGSPVSDSAVGRGLRGAWQVFGKELRDALRDRRTLLTVLLSSVALGPLLLVALSALVADIEARADARDLYAVGLDDAPTLANYIARQAWVVHPAPADHAQALVARTLEHPVLVVPPGFERDLAAGIAPELLLLSSSANQRAEGSAGSVAALVSGFSQEQASLRLALRGVPPAALQAVRLQRHDLGDTRARAAQFMQLLPFFVLMAVLYGALHAALDTTAGERERGSLEPLLMTPQPRWALVLGKWGAVAAMGMGVAVLACAGFLPGQWLLRSEALAALFQYGPRELVLFLALLLPVAALLAAVLMAVAIRCRSFKEAQASTTVVVLAASLLPMVTTFGGGGVQPWHLWVPALAQVTLMQRVLEGGALGAWDLLLPVGVAALLSALCLASVARRLRAAALQ